MDAVEPDVIEQNHVCRPAYDRGTPPTPSGYIRVTEFCECGRELGSHDDWII